MARRIEDAVAKNRSERLQLNSRFIETGTGDGGGTETVVAGNELRVAIADVEIYTRDLSTEAGPGLIVGHPDPEHGIGRGLVGDNRGAWERQRSAADGTVETTLTDAAEGALAAALVDSEKTLTDIGVGPEPVVIGGDGTTGTTLTDGGAVERRWSTAADWDGATAQDSVVHEDVANTDHTDAGTVKLGYSAETPSYAADLEGYYPLHDTGTTTADFSGNGRDGQTNDATMGAPGPLGTSSASFDTTGNAIALPTMTGMADGFTMFGWLKYNNIGSRYHSISIRDGKDAFLGHYDYFSSNEIAYIYDNGSNVAAGDAPPPGGEWAFYAATWDGSTLKIHDGTGFVGSTDVSGMAERSGTDTIGGSDEGFYIHDGEIWTAGFASRPFTESELSDLADVTNGSLTTATKFFDSPVRPDLTNLSYSLNGGSITVDVTGSPGTAEEETVTQTLDGATDYLLAGQWSSGHTDFQVTMTLSTPDIMETPTVSSIGIASVLNPDIAVSPPTIDYGEVEVGEDVSETVTLSNEGEGVLDVSRIAIDGPDAAAYVITSGGGTPSIPVGESHIIEVEFAPASVGTKDAHLSIESDDPDEPSVAVSLSGTGITIPDVAVSPSSLSFGVIGVGASVTETLALSNEGEKALDVSNIALGGADAAAYVITSGGETPTVGVGESHTIEVEFAPASVGTKDAHLSIESDDPDEPAITASLSGGAAIAYRSPFADPAAGTYAYGLLDDGADSADEDTVAVTRGLYQFHENGDTITDLGVATADGTLVATATTETVTPTASEELRVDLRLRVTPDAVGTTAFTDAGERALPASFVRPRSGVAFDAVAIGSGDAPTVDTDTALDVPIDTETETIAVVRPRGVSVRARWDRDEPAAQPVTVTEIGVLDSDGELVWRALVEPYEKSDVSAYTTGMTLAVLEG